MLREAELFVMAEQVLVEVLGRIREQDLDIVLPPMFDLPGADHAAALGWVVEQYAYDEACVPDLLAGGSTDGLNGSKLDREPLGDDRQAGIARIAEAASAAARQVCQGDAVVHAGYGDVATRDYLLLLTTTRSLLAHYVAIYLGSTACPLPEELARPLWEMTEPHADSWRSLGIFRNPLPVPEKASWRDTFLLSAGHEPHPLGH
jgi:hypothetical protein